MSLGKNLNLYTKIKKWMLLDVNDFLLLCHSLIRLKSITYQMFISSSPRLSPPTCPILTLPHNGFEPASVTLPVLTTILLLYALIVLISFLFFFTKAYYSFTFHPLVWQKRYRMLFYEKKVIFWYISFYFSKSCDMFIKSHYSLFPLFQGWKSQTIAMFLWEKPHLCFWQETFHHESHALASSHEECVHTYLLVPERSHGEDGSRQAVTQ